MLTRWYCSSVCFFFLSWSDDLRDLPSFPTRRSSDLKNRDGWTARYRVHRFDQICRANGIEHRLTKPNHPWTNGQVERIDRKSTRLNSSHLGISYAVFCLKKKKKKKNNKQ